MQGGPAPCRTDSPSRDRKEAYPFLDLQALGGPSTTAERREGPGGSCSPPESCGPQEETSSRYCQRDPLAGPTRENDSPSPETYG
eukprot:5041491-Amphidinium_carterae.1